jgi:hypothetical protein
LRAHLTVLLMTAPVGLAVAGHVVRFGYAGCESVRTVAVSVRSWTLMSWVTASSR